jgi:hypothetical protein
MLFTRLNVFDLRDIKSDYVFLSWHFIINKLTVRFYIDFCIAGLVYPMYIVLSPGVLVTIYVRKHVLLLKRE